MAASGSAQPVTPPKAAAPAPVAPAYPKWFSRPPALRPAGEHAPSAPTAPKAKAKKRSNRGPSQEWREGNRFRAMSELKDQEAAAAQQHVVQTQRDAFLETLQRQKAYYENKIQEYSLSLAANQQLQEDHSKMKQELTEAKVTYQENLQKQRAYYDKQIEGNKAAYQWLLEQHEKTKQDLQELKEAKTSYQEKLQRARAYYEKKIEDLNFMLGEAKKEDAEGHGMPKAARKAEQHGEDLLEAVRGEEPGMPEAAGKAHQNGEVLLQAARGGETREGGRFYFFSHQSFEQEDQSSAGCKAQEGGAGGGSACTAIVLLS